MSIFYRLALSICFILTVGISQAETSIASTPPDSTSTLVDRASALIMIEDGRTAFTEGRVRDALIKFRQASVKDPYSWRAVYNISKCHYVLNNYGFALKYVKKAMELGADEDSKEIYYTLGRTYHRLGNIDTAIINYQLAVDHLSKRRTKELVIRHLIDQCEFAKKALDEGEKFERVRMLGDMNSGFDDYNVVMADDNKTMYFTSRRSNTTGGGLNPDDQLFFEDIYKITYDEELGEWDEVTNHLGKLNSKGFESLNYISPDTLYGVITLNTTMMDIDNKTRVSDICTVKRNNKGTWNSPKAINNKTINTSFFDGAATLTDDGNTMIFVTDRKGEKSSTDIYMVEKVGKSWGTAKPIKEINSKGAETTPFITGDGQYLFFSSDGLDGMGGKDVYVSKNMGGSWTEPINLGAGINTVNDDVFFKYSPETKKAYISGYHIIGSKASMDIFEIDMTNFAFPE